MDKLTEEVRDIIGAKLVYEREFEERAIEIITLITDHNREKAEEAINGCCAHSDDPVYIFAIESCLDGISQALTTKEQGGIDGSIT